MKGEGAPAATAARQTLSERIEALGRHMPLIVQLHNCGKGSADYPHVEVGKKGKKGLPALNTSMPYILPYARREEQCTQRKYHSLRMIVV